MSISLTVLRLKGCAKLYNQGVAFSFGVPTTFNANAVLRIKNKKSKCHKVSVQVTNNDAANSAVLTSGSSVITIAPLTAQTIEFRDCDKSYTVTII